MLSREQQIEACPTPAYHKTHRYCPSCPWTEDDNKTTEERAREAIARALSVMGHDLQPSGQIGASDIDDEHSPTCRRCAGGEALNTLAAAEARAEAAEERYEAMITEAARLRGILDHREGRIHELAAERDAAEREVERLREALTQAPAPEHVTHDRVGGRSYARWYDDRRTPALLADRGQA